MDGVLRFGPVRVNKYYIGMKWRWRAQDILAPTCLQLGGSVHLAMEADFAADATGLELSIRDETGYTPTETLPGTHMSACP